MKTIPNKAKINVQWTVTPYGWSEEGEKKIIATINQKYGVKKENITITKNFVKIGDDGSQVPIVSSNIEDIQNPEFQQELMRQYIKINDIKDCDFEIIKKIDAEINGKIDYDVYSKFGKYSIKYIKFSNFLSYGENNILEFDKYKGLVLINGNPANQSGKTTLAIDLLHFLLFGKTDKADTFQKVFNRHIKAATQMEVEGCLSIKGENYIIKRTLSRVALTKRTERSKITNTVAYYKVVGDTREELYDEGDDCVGDSTRETNKIIKDTIGSEEDFNLMMSITEANLDELIDKKDTERGQLLTRWIGLQPIEAKYELAKEASKRIQYGQKCQSFSLQGLCDSIEEKKKAIISYEQEIKEAEKCNEEIKLKISNLELEKEKVLESKLKIDEDVQKIDIETLKHTIERVTQEGTTKKARVASIEEEIKKITDFSFEREAIKKQSAEVKDAWGYLCALKVKIENLETTIKTLENGYFCKYINAKCDKVDHSKEIEIKKQEYNLLLSQQENGNKVYQTSKTKLEELEKKQENYDLRAKLENEKTALEYSLTILRTELREHFNKRDTYYKNEEIIKTNTDLDIKKNNIDAQIKANQDGRDRNIVYIQTRKGWITENEKSIQDDRERINIIKEELIINKHYAYYCEMLGKKGISKMVLKNTLPIINNFLNDLLSDVCDFNVEIVLNDKNDAKFEIIKDGVRDSLTSASGFEKTCAALALRNALARVSSMPSCNYITMDEIFGRVAKDNLERLKTLIEKMLVAYDFIILIAHLDIVKDWCDTVITVGKKNNVSYIETKFNNKEKKNMKTINV